MPIDREFIIAALSGMLREGLPTSEFEAKYGVSSGEARRATIVAIQTLMQGQQSCYGHAAVARVRVLTQRFGFTRDEITNMAWEVLRGSVEDSEGDIRCTFHVVKYFLRDRLPRKMSFPCVVAHHFEPQSHPGGAGDLLGEVVYRDAGHNPHRPPEVTELLRDAGIDI